MANYHFIAIGGAGMSGIAQVLLELGHTVSGSDLKDSETTQRLKKAGALVTIGHAAENIPDDTQVVVVSSAIREDNPERLEAHRRGLEVLHRSDMLAFLLNREKGIAVAGTHGKTTTTGMVATVLEHANLDPTVLIGGEVALFRGNAKLGRNGLVVAEADESDGSFLKLRPHIGVVTNIDDDHLDHYGDIEAIKRAFGVFVHERIDPDGWAVYCADDANTFEVVSAKPRRALSYGFGDTCEIKASNLRKEQWGSSFDVAVFGQVKARIELTIPGRHNVLNALATFAVSHLLGVRPEDSVKALRTFGGAARRLQPVGEERGVYVFDDYSHHPTEIRAALGAMREHATGRVCCIYQPHRYARTLALKDEFGQAFIDCDRLLLADVYAGPGEKQIEGVGSFLIADAVNATTDVDAESVGSWDEIASKAAMYARAGDIVITMGAGDVHRIGHMVLERLRSK